MDCGIERLQQAVISQLYDIEREIKTLKPEERLKNRQARSKPLADKFHAWLLLQRRQVTDGTATAKALDYSLKRWTALTQFLDNGQLPIDNNWIENQIRPIAIGRNNANGSLMRTYRLTPRDNEAYQGLRRCE